MIAFDFDSIAVNHDLQSTVNNLIQYVKVESWKYCQKCHSVQPNKMMPNSGKQKMTFITNCICEKGRYSVYIYIYTLYIYIYIYIYTYIYYIAVALLCLLNSNCICIYTLSIASLLIFLRLLFIFFVF